MGSASSSRTSMEEASRSGAPRTCSLWEHSRAPHSPLASAATASTSGSPPWTREPSRGSDMKRLLLVPAVLVSVAAGAATAGLQDVCGPFTDVSPAICPYVLEMYYLGITAGTSPTTYSPNNPVTRGQAAVFVSKGVNQAIARSSRRAALGQWWTTTAEGIGFTPLPERAGDIASDGADLWLTVHDTGVTRVRASDGRVLETRTVANAQSVLVAMGRVFVGSNGALHMIDPAVADSVEPVVSDASLSFGALAFDGGRIWAVNINAISIVTPAPATPWPITTISGFENLNGIVFDGTSMWVTTAAPDRLLRLDAAGAVVQTVPLPKSPG